MESGNSTRRRKKSIAKKNQCNEQELTTECEHLADTIHKTKNDDDTIQQEESESFHNYSRIKPANPRKKSKARQYEINRNQQEVTIEEEQKLYNEASKCSSNHLNMILENWKNHIPNELEDRVLNVYTELKLNNIQLTDEVELALHELMLKRCCFQKNPITWRRSHVKMHMKLLFDIINIIISFEDQQEIFIFSLEYLVKEIHVLKQSLRSTYDKLPWEEIEFYLVCFIISVTQQHDLNVFYRAILEKTNLITFLKIFSSSLNKIEPSIMQVEEVYDLSKLPDMERSDAIHKIIEDCPDFKALYNHFDCIRDVHSLYKISKYTKLVRSTHPQEKGATKVIVWALYVISLHLKNTLLAPKLSQTTVDAILLSISDDSRRKILDLSNSVTYEEALGYRMKLLRNSDETSLQTIRNDVEYIGEIAEDLLLRHYIRLFRQQFGQKLMKYESLVEEIENTFSLFQYADKELQTSCVERYADKLKDNLDKLISEISNESCTRRVQLENIIKTKLSPKIKEFRLEPILLDIMKPEAKKLLTQSLHFELSIKDIQEIISIVQSIRDDDKRKSNRDKPNEIEKLCAETINLLMFELENDTWNENLKDTITASKKLSIYKIKRTTSKIIETDYQKYLSEILEELRGILEKSSYRKLKTDNKSLEIVKSLVLDAIQNVEIISDEEECVASKFKSFLEGDCELNDLYFNSNMAVFHIANILIQNGPSHFKLTPTKATKKIFWDYFITISKKQRFFSKLAAGDFSIFSKENADIKARNTEQSTYLHIAGEVCDNHQTETIKYLVDDQGLRLNCKNIRLRTPLHIAARKGNSEVVLYMMRISKSIIDDVDDCGRTALHIAVLNNHINIVKILLAHGSNPNVKDHLGFTSLIYAVLGRNKEISRTLMLEHIKLQDILDLRTLFRSAIKRNLFEIVEFLLSEKFVILDIENSTEAISSAVSYGRLEMLEVLLQQGINPKIFIDGKTALHIAVMKNQYQIIFRLIDAGSDPFVKDNVGKSALSYASSNAKIDILTYMLQHNEKFSNTQQIELQKLFDNALKQKDVDLVFIEYLLSKKLVILDDRKKANTVCSAVFNGQLEVLEILFRYGADPDNSMDGCAPILIAAQKNSRLLVEKLVVWKSDFNVTNPEDGMTALHYAAKNGNDALVEYLLSHHAVNMNSTDVKNQTPLHLAVENSNQNIVEIFLNREEINVNALNYNRYTPLHIAAAKGDFNIAKLLIEKGAMLDN